MSRLRSLAIALPLLFGGGSLGAAEVEMAYRIRVDLDGDGVEDQLLATEGSRNGGAGWIWKVMLHRDGHLVALGEITAHPQAISFEPAPERNLKDPASRIIARIWVYHRGSGTSGLYGYYRVGQSRIEALTSLELLPGDGGTALGRAVYDATFRHSPIPWVIEQRTSSPEGTSEWGKIRRPSESE